ncbi:MAG: universal stress protein [Actinobacteria bacterium]|nr:universal stress protein [Actinomycetota bacterium]
MISAASFAEAGEFETAREMLDGNRKVLLVLTGRETDVKSLKYAFSIAERTGAGLEVLAAEGSSTAEMLRLGEEKARQHGVPLKVTKKSGCIKEAVIKYARGRRDLVCVVIESTDALNSDCSSEQKRLSGIWEKLGCPLALVSEKSINEQEGALS